MVKWRRKAAFFAACIGLTVAVAGWALSEVRISEGGQLHFVPQAGQAQNQRYTLAVRGLSRGEVNGPPVMVEYLPGAVFGVYAPDAEGTMQPWPDPRAPQSPMLIRTEAEPVSFDLPDGMVFFVRQERAPQGYLPIAEGYWSIEGLTELRVDNAMPGGLEVRATDTEGGPLAGVRMRLLENDQLAEEGTTGTDGVWRVESLSAGDYVVESVDTPQDFLPAPDPRRAVTVRDAALAGDIFVYQRMGRVLVQAESVAMRPDGQLERVPLAGVGLQLLDVKRRPVSGAPVDDWRTDANGLAQSALQEGTYTLRVTGQPVDAPVSLPEETGFSVTDGQDTELILHALVQEGYVRFSMTGGMPAQSPTPLAGVRCVLWQGQTEVGTYTTDASGQALSLALTPGEYTVRYEGVPQGYALPEALRAGQALTVEPAGLTESNLLCPPVLTGRWTVCVGDVGESDGAAVIVERPVGEAEFAVLTADGDPVADGQGAPLRVRSDADGRIALTLPAGSYLLLPPGGDWARGQQALEEPAAFALPQERETVALRARMTRLAVGSVGQDGARLSGAAYRLTDNRGQVVELVPNARGLAVSPALEPGRYRVEAPLSPEGFASAEPVEVECVAGVPATVDMRHKPLGRLEIRFVAQALNAKGEAQTMPLAGAPLVLFRLTDGGREDDLGDYVPYPPEGTRFALTTDTQGVARNEDGTLPALVAGVYRTYAGDEPGFEERFSDPARVQDGEQSAIQWTARAESGGVRIALRDAEDAERPLTDAAFALAPLASAEARREGEPAASAPLTVDGQGFSLRVGLPHGRYRLWQTRCPEGYDPAPEQEIEIVGGELTRIDLFNARRGTLSVDKVGFTFDAALRQFRVPLSGAYGVYSLRGEVYEPYPSREGQMVLAAHGMRIDGAMEVAELPAAIDGAPYYLRELESAVSPGYVVDAEYHEVQVHPGQHTTAEIAAVADKGFFALTHLSADDGAFLTGGAYALHALTGADGDRQVWEAEPALTFTLTGETYQNEMALPVGAYLLRLLRAPEGYMLADVDGQTRLQEVVEIPPFMSRGNPVARVEMLSMGIPKADGSSLASGYLPVQNAIRTLRFDPADANADIVAVEIEGARDKRDAQVAVQVVYCLAQGGWNWADMREETGLEGGARTVDFSDVEGRIVAVQIRYLNAQSGQMWFDAGFSAGEARLMLADEGALPGASDAWTYTHLYQDERGERQTVRVQQPVAVAAVEPVAGREARTDRDWENGGVAGMLRQEDAATSDIAGARVRLERLDGQTDPLFVAEATPDARGAFRFDGVPYGQYRLRFVPAEGDLITGMTAWDGGPVGERGERGEGLTEVFELGAGQRWHWSEVGMDRAASARGGFWLDARFEELAAPVSGVSVSLWQGEELVTSALTDESGCYALTGLPAGDYTLRMELPEGMMFAATGQAPEQPLSLIAGQEAELSPVPLTLPASLAGSVLADRGTLGVASATVELLRDGFEQPADTAVTDPKGNFAFDGLMPGLYRLRISMPAAYAFPRGPVDTEKQGALGIRDALLGETEDFELGMGEARNDLRIEALRPAKVTVSAWEDIDYSGVRAEEAAGVAGVRVALAPEGASADQAETFEWRSTGPDGIACFERVEPGVYELWYKLPGTWRLTRRSDGKGGQLPMQPGVSGRGQRIVLGDGQGITTDIGLVLPASVRGAVWQDADDNGLWDAGEAPFEGAVVWLRDQNGALEARKAETSAWGAYVFDEVPPGAYSLTFEIPEGWVFAAEAEDSRPVQLGLGQALEDENMGVVHTASVRGLVWEDANDSGEMEADETGSFGASLGLYRLSGARGQWKLVAEQTPEADGAFAFTGLRPGTYQLECALPEGYVMGHAAEPALRFETGKDKALPRSVSLTLHMGETFEGVALAALRLGSMSGSLWTDDDYDGLRGQGERGLPKAATVALCRTGQSEPLAVTETGRNGAYRFDALSPGDYALRFTLPEGYVFTRQSDQSLLAEEGREAELQVALAMGEVIEGLDGGALMPASLGGLVWIDTNNDGMLDANEPPIQGATLTLLRAGDPERAVASAESDGQGRWRIEPVMPGTYVLSVALPEGYLFAGAPKWQTAARAGNIHSVDGSATVGEPFELTAGQRVAQYNVGGIPAAMIEGQVWLDTDDDGLRPLADPPVTGARVTLLTGGAPVREAETGAAGEYRFDGLRPGVYTLRFALPDGYLFARAPRDELGPAGLVFGGDASEGESAAISLTMGEQLSGQDVGALEGAVVQGELWLDADDNGERDDGEVGFEGARAEIMAAGTDEALAGVFTSADGVFRFDHLRPGTYQVRIGLPEGDLFASQAGEELDLLDVRRGFTEPFPLAMGEEADVGSVAALHGASVSGTVWEDVDVNGRFDAGEAPLADTGVTLLRQEDGDWKPVDAQQVDDGGTYRFGSLRPGKYSVRFTLPTGYLFTDFVVDAQNGRSMVPPADGETGTTEAFPMAMGETRADMHAGGIRPGMIGDYAWVDKNGNGLQDYGEPPLPDVKITLFAVGAEGSLTEVAGAVTDGYGLYRFDGLRPGLYRVRAALPDGFVFTTRRTDLVEIVSAIPEEAGATGESVDFGVRSGQSRRNIDIGARKGGE